MKSFIGIALVLGTILSCSIFLIEVTSGSVTPKGVSLRSIWSFFSFILLGFTLLYYHLHIKMNRYR